MPYVYVTADTIGAPTGGGRVTKEEQKALQQLGFVHTFTPRRDITDPFGQDEDVLLQLKAFMDDAPLGGLPASPKLAHVYAGCFGKSVEHLKSRGYKVCYTVAAHDVARSRAAHEALGMPFPYPHLNDPHLFERYVKGYVAHADLVIVPGSCCVATVRNQGRNGPIDVIPHGCDLPKETPKLPVSRGNRTFGYLGAVGPDKGLLTLAEAWHKYVSTPGRQGDRLFLAGEQSRAALPLFRNTPGTVIALGRVDDPASFFGLIGCYVQPSNTEGFGIPVLEALAHCRPVVCSDQAGAADLVPASWRFPAGDSDRLAKKLSDAGDVVALKAKDDLWFKMWQDIARENTWDKIHARYAEVWRQLLQ